MVTRSMAVKLKGPESPPPPPHTPGDWCQVRQSHVILDHFLYLLCSQLIYIKTRINVEDFFGH